MYIKEKAIPPHTESEQLSLTMNLLTHMNQSIKNSDSFLEIILEIQRYLKCNAVAIRFLGNNNYPYYVSTGLSDTFLKTEEELHPTGFCSTCNNQKNSTVFVAPFLRESRSHPQQLLPMGH